MHPALHIDEILVVIFSDPALSSWSDGRVLYSNTSAPLGDKALRRHPLLALALTCKTFHEPAAKALWRRVDGLDRLVRTMPRDLIEVFVPRSQRENRDADESAEGEERLVLELFGKWPTERCIIFKRDPTERDWTVFDRFAAYVQEFGRVDGSHDKFRLEGNIYQALRARYSPEVPILPQLRKLACSGCRQLGYADLLLPRPLQTLFTSLSVYGGCSSCTLAFIADAGNSNSIANLTHIHLGTHYIPQAFYSSFSDFLMTCAKGRVKSLYIPGVPITLDAMESVLQWQTLEELALRVLTFDAEVLGGELSRPHLRRFEVELEAALVTPDSGGGRDNFYSDLVTRLQAPGLVDLRLKGTRLPVAHDMKYFLRALCQSESFADEAHAWRTPCIRLLPARHYISEPTVPLPDAYICTFSNALHILCQPSLTNPTQSRFSQLRILELYETAVDMTDDELGILASALPRLKSLIFSARSHGREKSRTTLIGLWLLAKRCMQLETVSLLVDATLDWAVLDRLVGTTGNHTSDCTRLDQLAQGRNDNTHALHMGDSTIQDEDLVTRFLQAVFPEIKNLCYTNSREMTADMKRWRAVRHQLG